MAGDVGFQSALRAPARSDQLVAVPIIQRDLFQSALRAPARSDITINPLQLSINGFQSALRAPARKEISMPNVQADSFNPRSVHLHGATNAKSVIFIFLQVSIRAPCTCTERLQQQVCRWPVGQVSIRAPCTCTERLRLS